MRLTVLIVLFVTSSLFANKPLIVLIPGAGSSGPYVYVSSVKLQRYFKDFEAELKKQKLPFIVCPKKQHKDKFSIQERADECVKNILKELKVKQCFKEDFRTVILFGHSMGGLIARVIASDPKIKPCIQSVTTISTPHKGTPLANIAMSKNFSLNKLLILMSGFNPERLDYLKDLAVSYDKNNTIYSEKYNLGKLPLEDNIKYFTFSNSTTSTHEILKPFKKMIEEEMKAKKLPFNNDGMVPQISMTIKGAKNFKPLTADHWDSVCAKPYETKNCKNAKKAVFKHLKSQLEAVKASLKEDDD